ncbi:hypothetical protein P0Y35_05525 [Kiritimatiellaeota bacterium B1221]|nr:hypothetical protein [Kiritimatiellaeota bacterium B1221]
MPGLLIILFIGLAVVIAVISHQAEKKKQEQIRLFAQSRQLRFYPEKDRSFAGTFRDFRFLSQGSNRFAQYRMQGEVNGHQLLMCEYHYQVTTHNGKQTTTHHYWSTLVMLRPAFRLKPLAIRREGFFDKMKATFGWDDIDFSSAEFSRQFYVSSPDRDWAFAVVQPKTMDLLMRSDRDLGFYMEQGWLMLGYKKRMDLRRLEKMISLGCKLLDEIPSFCKENV